jgi:hypothetical protein
MPIYLPGRQKTGMKKAAEGRFLSEAQRSRHGF